MIKSKVTDTRPARVKLARDIQLLSRGYFAPESFPDGMITVYPWENTIDGWLVEHATKSSQVGLLWELLPQLCNLKGVDVDAVPIGDMNTIMLCSRALANRGQVQYAADCPSCGEKNGGVVKVPDELERIGEKRSGYPGWDEITLPESQDVVKIRPLTVKDSKFISGRTAEQRKKITTQLLKILIPVVDVNGGLPDSLDELIGWYNALDPVDKQYLDRMENELYPHLRTELDFKCDSCGNSFEVPLKFDESFFSPRR